jgi:hypothetical protein
MTQISETAATSNPEPWCTLNSSGKGKGGSGKGNNDDEDDEGISKSGKGKQKMALATGMMMTARENLARTRVAWKGI